MSQIEPVYGHSGVSPLSFRKIQPASGQAIYVVDDEEIDFETVLKEDPVPIPRAARYAGARSRKPSLKTSSNFYLYDFSPLARHRRRAAINT
jgi:hypothetical protein